MRLFFMFINICVFLYRILIPYAYGNTIDNQSIFYLIFLLIHMLLMYMWKPTNQINILFFPTALVIEILLLS